MRPCDVCDDFTVRPQPKHFAVASPRERVKLLKYIRIYVRDCDKQERLLRSRRKYNS